jgi:phosphohistidine swiveling domain-containing protein
MDLRFIPWEVDQDPRDLSRFIKQNTMFGNTPLVLEKNANSDLIAISKPPTQEFFERVFDPYGPFWSVYSELGFATRPIGVRYIAFINGQMYFLKNIENRFMNCIGPEKSFNLRDYRLREGIRPSISNLLLLLTTPFDAIRQQAGTIELGFMANEAVREFEEFRRETIKYHGKYSVESNIKNPLETARESLEKAVYSMRYTNLALLSYTLNIRLRKSKSIDACEPRQLKKLLEIGDWESIRKKFGFHSLTPYDISKPRFREDTRKLEKYGAPEPPEAYPLRWRENAKYLCSRYLDIERIAFKRLGETTGIGDLIYYLRTEELVESKTPGVDVKYLAAKRKNLFEKYSKRDLPTRIICFGGRIFKQQDNIHGAGTESIQSTSVSSKKTVMGPAVNINTFDDYRKCGEGAIIISKTLSPNLSILFKKAAAVISENGGRLSHAAVIAREMYIPCLVQARFPRKIRDGQYLQVNGKTGMIKILDRAEDNRKRRDERGRDKEKTYNEIRRNITAPRKPVLKDIVWLDESKLDSCAVGSKASNLNRLYKTHTIPPGFCVTDKVFREITASERLDKLIQEIGETDPGDMGAIDLISRKMREIISRCIFPLRLEKEIREAARKLRSKSLAVRSSSALEDLEEASFAGQLDSYIGINPGKLEDAIRKCWASFYNTRAILYRLNTNIKASETCMSVLVQEMIEPEYSGVMFTENPDNVDSILVEVVQGLCEDLVSGEKNPESYTVDRRDLSIKKQRKTFDFKPKTIKEIATAGLEIEETLRKPQDIEWSIDREGRLWILQSRPITASNR